MSLDSLLAKRLGRVAVTPVTPEPAIRVTPEPAQILGCTRVTPVTPEPAPSAGNDAGRPLPGVMVPATDPFDREQFGVECLGYLHAHGLVLALDAGKIIMHGTGAPLIREEAAALVELHRDDLLAALKAQEGAQQAIQRAARPCWHCRHLRTTSSATSRLPTCAAGHGLAWRTTTTRAWPGRLDASDCKDRQGRTA